ncbi:MAG TPA: L,D-transpeptidase family protein [Rhodothermales bacterium]|nr:L,D-transpeptidase family protein [Rhodothermales bacterium]
MPHLCVAQTDAALQGRIEARVAALPEGLAAFYQERGFAPLWTESPEGWQRAEVLLDVLQHAEQEGLMPEVYGAEALAAQVRAWSPGNREDPVRQANLELTLSIALFRYVAHLAQGRVPPATLHTGWAGTQRDDEVLALVRGVVTSTPMTEALDQLSPPYAGYQALRAALAHYRQIQAADGWATVHLDGTLRLGDRGATVPRLRRRLAVTEDSVIVPLDDPDLFDETLEGTVRAFQKRHGLEVDGIVGPQTLAALNVPVEARIRQIEYSLERWRWLPHLPDAQHILVNVAGGRLHVVDEGQEVLTMKVIVGKPSTPTPLFHSEIQGVVLAPYWYVPASITRHEILPWLKRDPGYLARHDMRWMPGGQLRQDPGPRNPLGRLKFIFPNRYSVGLHDTSEPHLFARSACAFSHGCMRLEKPIELALYTLRRDTSWTRARLEATIHQWKETRIMLPAPIPVYVLYWTAWVDEHGTVQFRSDIYHHDQALQRALDHVVLSLRQ